MSTFSFSFSRMHLAFMAALCILAGSTFLAMSDLAKQNPEIYVGVTYDLLLTAPLLYYFWAGKKRNKTLGFLVFAAGVVAAYAVLPAEESFHFMLIRYVLFPAFELFTIGTVLYYVVKTLRKMRKESKAYVLPDYVSLFADTASQVLKSKRVGAILGAEMAMLYYALGNWKRPKLGKLDFSYHKESGAVALYAAIVMLVAVETIALHFLLHSFSLLWAWLSTASSLYLFLLLLGHVKAMKRRPVSLQEKGLLCRNGLFSTCYVPYAEIDRVEVTDKDPQADAKEQGHLAMLKGLEQHNVLVYLKVPCQIEKMYGKKASAKVLCLHIDAKRDFASELMKKLDV